MRRRGDRNKLDRADLLALELRQVEQHRPGDGEIGTLIEKQPRNRAQGFDMEPQMDQRIDFLEPPQDRRDG